VEPTALSVAKGTCYALFAHEVGVAIHLDACERQITALTQRQGLRQRCRGASSKMPRRLPR